MITYNHERYVEQAVRSIFDQKTKYRIELVIGDDKSQDNTPQILKKLKKEFGVNIKLLLNESNLGVMGNVINTLKHCTGQYIAFCEGDDYWIDENKLENQIKVLNDNDDCSLVFSNRLRINEKATEIREEIYEHKIYTTHDVVAGFIPPTQTLMIRNFKDMIHFLSKNKNVYSGDRFISYYCSLMGYFFHLNAITAAYRDSGYGVWSQYNALEKVAKNYFFLIRFHEIIGLPVGNSITAKSGMDSFVNVFFYALKRPKLWFSHKIRSRLRNFWSTNRPWNRNILFIKLFFKRFLGK